MHHLLKWATLTLLLLVVIQRPSIAESPSPSLKMEDFIKQFRPMLYQLSNVEDKESHLKLKDVTLTLNGFFLSDSDEKPTLYAIQFGNKIPANAVQNITVKWKFKTDEKPKSETVLFNLNADTLIEAIANIRSMAVNTADLQTNSLQFKARFLLEHGATGNFLITPVRSEHYKGLKAEMIHLLTVNYYK